MLEFNNFLLINRIAADLCGSSIYYPSIMSADPLHGPFHFTKVTSKRAQG